MLCFFDEDNLFSFTFAVVQKKKKKKRFFNMTRVSGRGTAFPRSLISPIVRAWEDRTETTTKKRSNTKRPERNPSCPSNCAAHLPARRCHVVGSSLSSSAPPLKQRSRVSALHSSGRGSYKKKESVFHSRPVNRRRLDSIRSCYRLRVIRFP